MRGDGARPFPEERQDVRVQRTLRDAPASSLDESLPRIVSTERLVRYSNIMTKGVPGDSASVNIVLPSPSHSWSSLDRCVFHTEITFCTLHPE